MIAAGILKMLIKAKIIPMAFKKKNKFFVSRKEFSIFG